MFLEGVRDPIRIGTGVAKDRQRASERGARVEVVLRGRIVAGEEKRRPSDVVEEVRAIARVHHPGRRRPESRRRRSPLRATLHGAAEVLELAGGGLRGHSLELGSARRASRRVLLCVAREPKRGAKIAGVPGEQTFEIGHQRPPLRRVACSLRSLDQERSNGAEPPALEQEEREREAFVRGGRRAPLGVVQRDRFVEAGHRVVDVPAGVLDPREERDGRGGAPAVRALRRPDEERGGLVEASRLAEGSSPLRRPEDRPARERGDAPGRSPGVPLAAQRPRRVATGGTTTRSDRPSGHDVTFDSSSRPSVDTATFPSPVHPATQRRGSLPADVAHAGARVISSQPEISTPSASSAVAASLVPASMGAAGAGGARRASDDRPQEGDERHELDDASFAPIRRGQDTRSLALGSVD